MALSQDVIDSVVDANLKNLGDAPAIAMGSLFQTSTQNLDLAAKNAIANQQRMNEIGAAATTLSINKLINMDPGEASAINTVNSGEIAKALSQLGASVAGLQQMMKGAQTTPPVTP